MLFTDPRTWTKHAVGSWWRFALMATILSAWSVYAVFVAAESGVRTGVVMSLTPIMFQLFFLYALKRTR